MKVFVATKLENKVEAQNLMGELKARGYKITHDWTLVDDKGLSGEARSNFMTQCALDDWAGVAHADVLIMINYHIGRGMYTEEGIAMALNKPVIVLYPDRAENVYFYTPGHYWASSKEEVFSILHDLESKLPIIKPETAMNKIERAPAAPTNYAKGRNGTPVSRIILHTMQGSLNGTKKWFADPKSRVSAHYSIGFGGEIVQHVELADTAYHAGNLRYNLESVGIELEGFMEKGYFPEEMMKSLTDLCEKLIQDYNIPRNRTQIMGHNEVPNPYGPGLGGAGAHKDPGPLFPWDDLMRRLTVNNA